MPSKKQYNLVNDDAYDCRIPLYNEEAFHHGITFHAKYIGSLDVPRPTSRVEIVAAMRRIRYEFKAKSVKKKKVSITISVDGVKVGIRNKKKSNQWLWDENKFTIMHHPIYRIFYVSHDSQDLKIFSYIARDGGTNAFKCNVFKSKKKSQAMRIVRTVGQAFEVCHKLSLAIASTHGCSMIQEEIDYGQLADSSHNKGDGASEPSCDTQVEEASSSKCLEVPVAPIQENSVASKKLPEEKTEENGFSSRTAQSLSQLIQMLKDQLENQNKQMADVSAQVQILKDQLAAETTARLQSQAQNAHLLAYNRELLEHISKLIHHFHELENKYHAGNKNDVKGLSELLPLPQFLFPSMVPSFPNSEDKFDRSNSSPKRLNSEFLFPLQNSNISSSNITLPVPTGIPPFESRNHYLTGQSLPGSPLRRNFSSDTESLKSNSSFSNLPSLKNRVSNESVHPPEPPATYSTHYVNNGKHSLNDSFSFFDDGKPTKLSSDLSSFPLPYLGNEGKSSSTSSNAANSFIANMADDLAKMSMNHKVPPRTEKQYSSLFSS